MKKISLVLMLVVLGAVLLTGCDGWDVTVSGSLTKEYAGTYSLSESITYNTFTFNGETTRQEVILSAEQLAQTDSTYVIDDKGNVAIHTSSSNSGSSFEISMEGTLSVNKTAVTGHDGNSVLIFTITIEVMAGLTSDMTAEYDPEAKSITTWDLASNGDVNSKSVYTLIS